MLNNNNNTRLISLALDILGQVNKDELEIQEQYTLYIAGEELINLLGKIKGEDCE